MLLLQFKKRPFVAYLRTSVLSGEKSGEKSVKLEGGHPVQGICAASFKIRRIMLRGKGVLIINSRIRRKQTMIW